MTRLRGVLAALILVAGALGFLRIGTEIVRNASGVDERACMSACGVAQVASCDPPVVVCEIEVTNTILH